MQHAVKIWGDRPPIPLQLLWVGFAINTIFYGVLLWVLMLGLLRGRRVRRRKRGLCGECGYDLRGTSGGGGGGGGGCPECGWGREEKVEA